MSRVVILYTGDGCHLCDQARDLVCSVIPPEWQYREVDIRGDTHLNARYGLRIPVIAVEGGDEKGWPFTAGQLRRLLQAAPAS